MTPTQLLAHIHRNECHSKPRSTFAYLMRSFPATLTREIYGSAIYFGTYAFMKEYLSSITWLQQPTTGVNDNSGTEHDQFYMVEDISVANLAVGSIGGNGGGRRQLGASDYMLSGAMSGVAYWLCVYPLDLVKSRVHCGHRFDGARGVFGAVRQIAHQEGVRALYFGLQPTILRSLFSSGIMFLCYEKTLEYLLGGHS